MALFNCEVDPDAPWVMPMYSYVKQPAFFQHEDGRIQLAWYQHCIVMVPAKGVELSWRWLHLDP